MKLMSLLDDEKDEDDIQKESELHDISDPPLHVAALLSDLQLTRELLSRNPELAGALNSQGSSALHVASAKGYLEIVKELVLVNPDLCFVLDRDGRTPLHLAAMKGRLGVLTELVRVRPEATRVLARGGDTCLHLCVKYNRLEALKLLVEDVFVNWKDQNGNTILHLAVANKQIQIIKFLLVHTGIEINAPNANGFTALDVLSKGPRDLRDMEIKHCLTTHDRATLIKSTLSIVTKGDAAKHSSITDPQEQPKNHKHIDWLGRKRSSLMIVASLLATVAFQAGLSPPGGVWADNYTVDANGNPVDNPHEAGKSVMAYRIPRAYGQFMIFNTIAFLASLSIIMLLVSGLPMKRRRWMWTQMVTMWVALSAQTATYFITLVHMTPDTVRGTLYEVTKISVLGWLSMMAVVLIGNIVRVVRYFLIKYGYIQEKEKEAHVYAEEDENDEL